MYLETDVTVAPYEVFRPLVFFASILFIVIGPAYWITKDWHWTSIFLTIFVLTFLSPTQLFQIAFSVIGVFLLPYFIYLIIKKGSIEAEYITSILNPISLLFVVVQLSSIYTQVRYIDALPIFATNDLSNNTHFFSAYGKPDIYYIVLDGYGRADILEDYYGFNNNEFITMLREKGFVVPNQSRSNYPKTVLSVTSTLNMNYISELKPDLENVEFNYWWLLSPLIDNSKTRLILEENGYRSYTITTGWSVTDNPYSNVHYQPSPIIFNDLEFFIFSKTPLKLFAPLLDDVAYIPSFDNHRDLILYNFNTLSKIYQAEGPKFVFAHIISPHPPFIFDENGQPLVPSYNYSIKDGNDIELPDGEYKDGYIEQLKFLNKELEKLIVEILKNSKAPPIIILQADHGPGMLSDFSSIQNTCLRERFSVFAAYYLPYIESSLIPETITPVNLFRIIFNEYFGAKLDILPNYQYSYDGEVIFQSLDVTPLVDTCSINR